MLQAKVWIALLLWPTASLGRSLYRQDLGPVLGPLICSVGNTVPQARDLWKKGIYDAGVQVFLLKPTGQSPLAGSLASKAQELAASQHHKGYSFGHCPNRSTSWVATTPAPIPLQQAEGHTTLNMSHLRHFCRLFRADYAPAGMAKPRKLLLHSEAIKHRSASLSTALLGRGSLSVSCRPRKPKWLGQVLWYLAPVGEGPYPQLTDLGQERSPPLRQGLFEWINKTRREMGIQELAHRHSPLHDVTQTLIEENLTVAHNRRDLGKASGLVKQNSGAFIGENRVMAKSLAEAAWLLWNSPRHRHLLLSTKATHMATSSRQVGSSELAVMVFAKF